MKKLLIICFCFVATISMAQDNAKAYIEMYKNIAISEMQRTGVPAAISLAQGIVESGCGTGDLCKISNNHFGIKCKPEWTGDRVYHDDDERKECFRSYSSGAESYKDHSDFLKTREPYAFLFNLNPTDYIAWAKGLKKAGYATEKDYPQKLIKVINDYSLNQYTLLALNKLAPSQDTTATVKVIVPTSKGDSLPVLKTDSALAGTILKDTVLGEMIIPVKKYKAEGSNLFAKVEKETDSFTVVDAPISINKESDTIKNNYPSGAFSINHTKVIYVPEGTGLLSIASQYDISLAKLLEYNDMSNVDIITAPQLVFLEKKQTKGDVDLHVAKANQSLLDISQMEGVRLEKILEYNKLTKRSKIKAGDKILLRPTLVTYGVSK